MAALVFCIAGAAGFCFWWNKSHSAQAKVQVQPEEELTDNDRLAALFGDEKALGKVDRTDSSNPIPVKFAPAPRVPERPQPARATVATTPAPVPAPAPVVQTPVRFPPLRLQSIFYRPSSPSVIINGKTLFVTDEINGVTVADIQPSSVTLVLSGQTNVLTLR